MTHLHIDFETRSTVDLKKTGAFVYAEDPTTDLWCACYCFDDGPIETWRPGEPCPDAIAMHVLEGGVLALLVVLVHGALGVRRALEQGGEEVHLPPE